MTEETTSYTLPDQLSVVRERKSRAWLMKDIRTMPTAQLFADYLKMEVAVADAFGEPFTFNPYDCETELRNYTGSLATWLTDIGNRSIPLSVGFPTLESSEAQYFPLWHRKATAQLARRGWHPSHYTPRDDAADVVVEMEGIDSRHLYDHVLWSVNGFIVKSSFHDYGCRVLEAGDIVRRSGKMNISGLNFETVGKVTTQDLTDQHIFKVDESKRYFDGVHIKLDKPLGNRTVGIVIGGYLHLLDDLVRPISQTTLRLTPGDLNIIERVLLSKDSLDLEFMKLNDLDKGQQVSAIMDDVNWFNYLTSKYTFLVFIDNVDMWKTTSYVNTVSRPGLYVMSDTEPMGQLTDNVGRMINYWPKFECMEIALCSDDYMQPNYALRDTSWLKDITINDAGIGAMPYRRINPKMNHFHGRKK